MATTLHKALTGIVDVLTAAGVNAAVDPRDLNLPGVWVTVHDITDPTLCGDYSVRAQLCLIVGDFGTATSLHHLDGLLAAVADVVTFDEPVRPARFTPPGIAPCHGLSVITSTDIN